MCFSDSHAEAPTKWFSNSCLTLNVVKKGLFYTLMQCLFKGKAIKILFLFTMKKFFFQMKFSFFLVRYSAGRRWSWAKSCCLPSKRPPASLGPCWTSRGMAHTPTLTRALFPLTVVHTCGVFFRGSRCVPLKEQFGLRLWRAPGEHMLFLFYFSTSSRDDSVLLDRADLSDRGCFFLFVFFSPLIQDNMPTANL